MSSKDKPKTNLKYSFYDGVFTSSMNGFTQEYFIPFLLFLGGTVKEVGMLTALPNFVAALAQLKSADIVEKAGSRKKIILIFVFLQALMLAPIAFIASSGRFNSPFFFILSVVFFTTFGAIATPAWGSMMSDLVNHKDWGKYFGWRNRVLGFVTVALTFISGFILNRSRSAANGFLIIFFFAFIFRMVSCYFLSRMSEIPLEHKKEDYFNMYDFLVRIRKSNFAKFVIFVSLMNFSVNLAAPFFAVLMLKELGFSYILYTIVTISASLTMYLTIERWGKHADQIGNLKILRFVSPLIGIIPLLWVINRTPLFLIIFQVMAGFAWAGFNLCATNFIYDAVSPEKRTRCISYFNVLNGMALCLGAITGGFLIEKLPPLFGHRILTLFLISSFLRIIVGIFMPMSLKEVKYVEKVTTKKLLYSVIGFKPLLGIERKTIRY